MLRNSTTDWGWVSRILHWLMAVLIFGQFILGKYAHELERTPEKLSLMMWHKSIGITLLFIVLLRLLWSLANPRPAISIDLPRWERISARIGPDKALGKVFEEWHEVLGIVLLGLLLVHIGAALWHHFLKKDTILLQMLRSGKAP